MMTLIEYAEDINKTTEEVLNICNELKIKKTNKDDLLDQEEITLLDNFFESLTKETNTVKNTEEIKPVEESKTHKKEIKIDKVQDNESKDKFKEKIKKMYKNKEKLMTHSSQPKENEIVYDETMTVGNLALQLKIPAAEIIKKLFLLGSIVNINNTLEKDQADLIADEYKKVLIEASKIDVSNFEEFEVVDKKEDLVDRAPIVTIMGHVDHGKTTLLDKIRKSTVVEGEAGGITQSINAYQVKKDNKKITFIDTPGHAAFTEMRSRGAKVTDIIIIIVAADDGIKEQTKEVIDHALAAEVPIIVAINKIDKPNINIEKVKTELSEYGLSPEDWGGDTLFNLVSAKTGEGIDELLENILLIAELEDYKVNPKRYATGTVIEANLDKQTGNIANLLIENGTLRIGDHLVIGNTIAKVRTMKNSDNKQITEAKPSEPVQITGLTKTPLAGDKFMAFETEKEAKKISEQRLQKERSKSKVSKGMTLDDLFSKIQDGRKLINLIIKTDLQGSAEALKNSLQSIEVDGVKVKIIRSSVGAITNKDISLAETSKAIIIGFNIQSDAVTNKDAKDKEVEIRLYTVIYKVIEDIELAMEGLLDPVFEEKVLGTAEVRKLYKFSKTGIIAGSFITDGIVKSNAQVRIIRDKEIIFDGFIKSIQREKDSVREVKKGLECGITIKDYNDIIENDIIEAYEMVEVKRK